MSTSYELSASPPFKLVDPRMVVDVACVRVNVQCRIKNRISVPVTYYAVVPTPSVISFWSSNAGSPIILTSPTMA